MAKRNLGTTLDQAPLVIALGPGYTAGVDCHAVIETNRGHRLGRVIWHGPAEANTGTPGIVAGKGAERVLRAPAAGVVTWHKQIGDLVRQGEVLGEVDGQPVVAPFDGVARGLIAPGTVVPGSRSATLTRAATWRRASPSPRKRWLSAAVWSRRC
jgi:xanthine dehydrogenase accessory factor